jgi:hypothetical protein
MAVDYSSLCNNDMKMCVLTYSRLRYDYSISRRGDDSQLVSIDYYYTGI